MTGGLLGSRNRGCCPSLEALCATEAVQSAADLLCIATRSCSSGPFSSCWAAALPATTSDAATP